MKQMIIILALLLCGSITVQAQRQTNYYVILRDNSKVYGTKLSATNDGRVSVHDDRGGKQTFSRTRIRAAVSPKPAAVMDAEDLVSRKQYDRAFPKLDAAFNEYRWIGWGAYICNLRGLCHLKKNAIADAEAAFEEGRKYPANSKTRNQLRKSLVEVYLQQGKTDEAEKILRKMKPNSPEASTFVFNTRGKVLAAKGKKDMAVLSYLKTIMLYPNDPNTREAYKEVIALLREMKDNRADDFDKELRRRFN
ncbi:MAG: hypothetical protein ACKJSG_08820 [Lentisphaeria bacterium]